ncbi:MAG: putative toxin-antitoxin system toxin component, PIN family [Gammaproteobacteria bacterium]|nr:putative toxin-antitoxin system toxin component, PIN family [Gammaproteobacteria bacterium]
MVITVDTNVILAGLLSQEGASHKILNLVIEEKLHLALTTSVVLEYDDVLKRPGLMVKHQLNTQQIEEILDLLILLAKKEVVYYRLRPNLLDENDNFLIECAFKSNSNYLVTSNVKDFNQNELKHYPFVVLTPREFYQLWRTKNE